MTQLEEHYPPEPDEPLFDFTRDFSWPDFDSVDGAGLVLGQGPHDGYWCWEEVAKAAISKLKDAQTEPINNAPTTEVKEFGVVLRLGVLPTYTVDDLCEDLAAILSEKWNESGEPEVLYVQEHE